MNVNQAAFCTVTALAALTAGTAVAAATTATTVASVVYGILALGGSAVSIASVTAYLDERSVSVESYFERVVHHAGYTIPGTCQFVAQAFVQAMVEGFVRGISSAISRKIGGDDLTIRIAR